jgi:carboxyl-terminal processing protease
LPLIILVNEYSASASEIVAGAVAGLKGACVVGTRTFGKGSVQNLIPIADNRAYLKLTTAHYYVYDRDLPGDHWYCLHHREDADSWGVEPHVKVDIIPQEIAKILRLRRDRDVLKGRDQDAVPDAVLDRRPTSRPEDELPEDQYPEVDPQLNTAVNLMRMKLLSGQPWAMPPRTFRALSQGEGIPKQAVER